ncbi:polysaccharide pyruvyl transferase family protein [Methanomassiliicoccus luminyensis]|uniref:polysaccharide pyruvyl transferase family protein n=1 Tax=Methanomassiliicoccus luminyensis TaxID=1080712 RepID=UPI00037279CF|nr:polysaccharide pyruvyl transferase family protein [Methanomassiliicoccus luminyensis]
MKDELTITIANWAGVNTGDDAIFSSLLNVLKSAVSSKLTVYVLADNEKEIQRKFHSVAGTAPIFEYYKPQHLPRVLGFLRRSDLVIYGGGDLINGDLCSMSFLRLAKLMGVPVMCCSVGALPLQSSFQRFFTRRALNCMDAITVRDESSKDRLQALGVDKVPIQATADLAFLLLPKLDGNRLLENNGHSGASMTIGVNVRSQDEMYYFYSTWDEDKFLDTVASVCNRIISDLDAHIVFLPMETCERKKYYHTQVFDETIGHRILGNIERKDRFSMLAREYTPDELKGLLSHMDLLIAMRLHTLLIASDQGIPMVAFDYAPKLHSFMSQIGREDFLVDTTDLSEEGIMEKVRTALQDEGWRDKERVRSLCKRSQENVDVIKDVLETKEADHRKFYTHLPLVPLFVASNYAIDLVLAVKGRSARKTKRRRRPFSPVSTGSEKLFNPSLIQPFMVSPQVEKLFNSLKSAGIVSEDKAVSAEKATSLSKLPKAQCMNALAELEKMGAVKKRKKNNAVDYYLVKTAL